MSRLPRLTAQEAITLLEEHGFVFSRQTGSHMMYYKNGIRANVPKHGSKILHPKIVKQVMEAIQQ